MKEICAVRILSKEIGLCNFFDGGQNFARMSGFSIMTAKNKISV
jgi:hypothetical protein